VRKIGDLTGVSKYFYDLDETLNTKSTNPPLEIISKLATELKTEIGGEFIFENGRLSFVDDLNYVQTVRCHHHINATFCQFD
jgi:hypothetical protein